MRMLASLTTTAALGVFLSCQYPWAPGDRSCADHARLDLPIDLTAFMAQGSLLPFGVHSGFNPEGHSGMDFILDTADSPGEMEVKASFNAEILSITPESDYPGSSCLVMDSACIEVNLCHLQLDKNLKVGNKVKRGQKLGIIGLMKAAGKYNLHFGTYSGKDAALSCPSDFLNPDTVRCILGLDRENMNPGNCPENQTSGTLFSRSRYPEALARELTVKCADGSTQIFSMPAETTFCAPRLGDQDRSRMNKCLGSACAGIW